VSFDLLEETFTDKFRDIKIGEFFGFQLTSSQKCIGVKTRENEALVYNEEYKSLPAIYNFSPSEDVIAYNTVIALKKDRSMKECE
jgi:hypothetical protein